MTKRIKNHHFVPRVLQKGFCFEPERIWYSTRIRSNGFTKPVIRNTESTFRIKDYYTVIQDGLPSDVVERKFYGAIDDYLGKMLPGVLESFEKNVVPVFSGNPLDSLRKVVHEMIKRTPEFTKSIDEEAAGAEVVRGELALTPDLPENVARIIELHEELADSNRLKKLGRHLRVTATIKRSPAVEKALSDFSVRWATTEGKHSFILSSLMAYRIGNGGHNGLANPDMEMWMPITSKKSLVLIRDPKNEVPLVNTVNRDKVRRINEYAMQNSNQVASHSETLIASLV